jgi:hypothetical protein
MHSLAACGWPFQSDDLVELQSDYDLPSVLQPWPKRGWGGVVHSDDWGDGDAGLGHAPVTELVHSPSGLAWICTAALAVSAVLILPGQLWLGYLTGVAAAALCMVTTVVDRQKRASPNYVATTGLQVEQRVRMVRIAAFIVCLIHIIRLAQQAAQ